MRGYNALHREKARRRTRPFKIAAAVLILAVSGKLFMVYGGPFMAAAGSAITRVLKKADDMRNPSNYAAKQVPPEAEPPAVPAEAPGSPVAPEHALRAQLFAPDAPPAQGPAPAPSASAPPARPFGLAPLAKNSWRVSGTVYDLTTLAPVQGADITFLRDSKEPATATTNDNGAYEVDLVKSDGWTVSLEAHDHRRGQILDIDPPYRVRDADERRAVLEHITDGDLTPAPVGWKRASSKVKLDLIAVPLNWTDSRQR